MKDALLTGSATSTAALSGLPAALPLVGRVLLGAIFLISGLNKIADPAGTIGYINSAGLPLPQLALAVAIAVEVVGSVLLILGFQTRLVAAALACFTLASAFSFHFDLADQNQFIHFMKNLALAGGLLQIVAFGGGRYSISGER
jgi:putative oxidoreductase